MDDINKLVKEAVPRCSPNDTSTDFFRYVVWLENPLQTVKGRTKAELRVNLKKVLIERRNRLTFEI